MATATQIRERPILFSGEMVRAILDGRKTQTRRPYRPQPLNVPFSAKMEDGELWWELNELGNWHKALRQCPFGKVGDRLWVRESWQPFFSNGYIYLADAGTGRLNANDEQHAKKLWPNWKPSNHMPREASRITLEITGVRVERLQSITETDARDEGVEVEVFDQAIGSRNYTTGQWFIAWDTLPDDVRCDLEVLCRESFRTLWKKIHGDKSWDNNPWVWVVEFQKL